MPCSDLQQCRVFFFGSAATGDAPEGKSKPEVMCFRAGNRCPSAPRVVAQNFKIGGEPMYRAVPCIEQRRGLVTASKLNFGGTTGIIMCFYD